VTQMAGKTSSHFYNRHLSNGIKQSSYPNV